MSFEQIKAESMTFTREQRREMIGHLLALGRQNNPEFQRRLAQKIDDHDPAHWVAEEELDRALGLDGAES